jgi:galactose-1-phosphate uridylyltransferase
MANPPSTIIPGYNYDGEVWEEPLGPVVDFSAHTRSGGLMKHHSTRTEHEGMDLASGFPSHLIWTTSDGRRIAIPNLTDAHLVAILKALNKAQRDLSHPQYIQLIQEFHRRGLT